MLDENNKIDKSFPEEKETQTNIENGYNLKWLENCISFDFNKNNKINKLDYKKKVFYKKLSYNDVCKQINKYYEQDIVHKYSSALDILASYLKGQKIIYMEARNYTVIRLNKLMFLLFLLLLFVLFYNYHLKIFLCFILLLLLFYYLF